MAVKCLRIGENLNLGIVLRLLQKFESDIDLSQFKNEKLANYHYLFVFVN